MRLSPAILPQKHAAWAVALTTVAYLVLFALLSRLIGIAAHALSTIPVLLAAWLLGTRGAFCVWSLVTAFYVHASYDALSFGASPGVTLTSASASLLLLGLSIGLLRDRTERLLERQQLLEARYERAARGANDVLWEYEVESGAAHFSAQWPALLGTEDQAPLPHVREWLEKVHPEDLPRLRTELDRLRRGETARFENEHRLRRKDGSQLWVSCRGVASSEEHGEPLRITGWLTDITEHKRSEAQLRRLAFHDALTGLPNRSLFVERLRQAHERSQRRDTCFAVLLADLDRFKVVNDSLGHSAGDLLLMRVSRILRETVRPVDTIARLGGDEFVILIEDLERSEQADDFAAEILGALNKPLDINGHRVVTGASIGISRANRRRGSDPEEMIREADIAMYRAKRLGGGRVELYDPRDHEQAAERLDLEAELRKALEGKTLDVHYQPIVDVDTCSVVGFEALARWRHPVIGPVSPGKFIPVAEEAGLIEELGECVLRIACRQAARLRTLFPEAAPWRMGVNLAVAQLGRADLLSSIEDALADCELPGDYLSLEITESGLLEDTEAATRTFAALQQRGVRLAMDDFGTGYSSLQYLRRFRVDTLKIDGSFVRDLEHAAGEEICAAIITLGRDLGLSVIAEGVERPAELERLRRLGGRYAQGFLLSKPLAAADLEAWLQSLPSWQLPLTG